MKKGVFFFLIIFLSIPLTTEASWQPTEYTQIYYKDDQYIYYSDIDIQDQRIISNFSRYNFADDSITTFDSYRSGTTVPAEKYAHSYGRYIFNDTIQYDNGYFYYNNAGTLYYHRVGEEDVHKIADAEHFIDFLADGGKIFWRSYSLEETKSKNDIYVKEGVDGETLLLFSANYYYFSFGGIIENSLYYFDNGIKKINCNTKVISTIKAVSEDRAYYEQLNSFYYDQPNKTVYYSNSQGIFKFSITNNKVYAVRKIIDPLNYNIVKDEGYHILTVQNGWIYFTNEKDYVSIAYSPGYAHLLDWQDGQHEYFETLARASIDGLQYQELQPRVVRIINYTNERIDYFLNGMVYSLDLISPYPKPVRMESKYYLGFYETLAGMGK